MKTLWFISSFLLIYIYVGYPIILWFLAWLFPRSHKMDENLEPAVTLIISAYNEEKIIKKKLENALQLDYPPKKLTILVVSDASTDKTDQIVCSFHEQGVISLRTKERKGKTAGLNMAMERVSSDLVLFSDANALYHPSALRKIVRHFADEQIGYVVGLAAYKTSESNIAGLSEGSYWDLETRLKGWESTFSSVVGADGAIYAIKKNLWEPLKETDINDFVNPLQIIVKRFRGIFDSEAICFENPADDFGKEFNRKVRISNRSFNGILRVPQVLNIFKLGRFSWQIISHKLLRWFSPYFLAFHFIITLAVTFTGTGGPLPGIVLNLYGAASLLALIGYQKDGKGAACSKIFYLPYYFCLLNIAGALGVWLRLLGKVISTWETVREGSSLKKKAGISVPVLLWVVILSLFLNWTVRF